MSDTEINAGENVALDRARLGDELPKEREGRFGFFLMGGARSSVLLLLRSH